jgi:hypothetical protein
MLKRLYITLNISKLNDEGSNKDLVIKIVARKRTLKVAP